MYSMRSQPTMIQRPMGDWSDLIQEGLGLLGIGQTEEERRQAEYNRQAKAFEQQQQAALALAEAQANAAREQAELEARQAASAAQRTTATLEMVAIGGVVVLALVGTWIAMRKKK